MFSKPKRATVLIRNPQHVVRESDYREPRSSRMMIAITAALVAVGLAAYAGWSWTRGGATQDVTRIASALQSNHEGRTTFAPAQAHGDAGAMGKRGVLTKSKTQ